MERLFTKTLKENTTAQTVEIKELGKKKLNSQQLQALFAVVSNRYENFLPTVTYTNLKRIEIEKAIDGGNDGGVLAGAIIGRLWEMGVRTE